MIYKEKRRWDALIVRCFKIMRISFLDKKNLVTMFPLAPQKFGVRRPHSKNMGLSLF